MTREEELQQFAEKETKGLYPDKHNLIMMVKAGAKWADSHPHWIPVEEELPPVEGEYIAIGNGMPDVFWVDYLEPFGWCVEIMGAHEVVKVKWWCYPPKED